MLKNSWNSIHSPHRRSQARSHITYVNMSISRCIWQCHTSSRIHVLTQVTLHVESHFNNRDSQRFPSTQTGLSFNSFVRKRCRGNGIIYMKVRARMMQSGLGRIRRGSDTVRTPKSAVHQRFGKCTVDAPQFAVTVLPQIVFPNFFRLVELVLRRLQFRYCR